MRPMLILVLALALVPAALSADPHTQTISGVLTANSGASLTVSASGRSLTCLVPGAKAQAAIARWGVGVQAAMACKEAGNKLLLARLTRKDSKDTKQSGGDTTTTTTTTTPTTPTPTPTKTDTRQVIGIVTALSSDGVTVKPESGDALRCRITAATDSKAAAAKLTLGARVGIVCRRDGDSYVLSGATSG